MVENGQAGLTDAEVRVRLQEYGPNRLPQPPQAGILLVFLRQFASPFIYILIAAALASFLLGQFANAVFIFAVLLLNAAIGTVQEYSAQKSAAALRDLTRGHARVIRDGELQTIDSEMLVPGDLVVLESGDKVPADMHLHESRDLAIDESMLTGESIAVEKTHTGCSDTAAALTQQDGNCFAGTMVNRGRARGVVYATAMHTQLGLIAHELKGQRQSEPPLMIRIRRFTYQAAAAILGAIVLLVLMMLVRGGYSLREMAMMSIGLAVSAIPEGLPAALTVALSIGMRRMAKLQVIIRKLIAVEALGSCTFICSDKTGTLTINELTIAQVLLPDGTAVPIDTSSSISGAHAGDQTSIPAELRQPVEALCLTGVLANESQLEYGGQQWTANGDIVDVAFLLLAKKMGLSLSGLRHRHAEVDLIPYESEKAYSGSVNRATHTAEAVANEGLALHVKGSPERILGMCTWMQRGGEQVPVDAAALERQYTTAAREGYRMIALARRAVSDLDDAERLADMVFLGMVAMIDPVRPEARQAIERCRSGGIEVAMITGDHPETARAIASELGLCSSDAPVVAGAMIREADDDGEKALNALVHDCRVFARIEPRQKQRIVQSLMAAGHFVAVTGDGVNDAPAMQASNVGVAMGKRGTDVAKETAQLIIADDNFASLVDGIEQGRIVYNNIRKVIALLIATGFSALLLFFLSVAAGFPMPMHPIQLLWLNLVANGMQDVALAFEPKEGGELEQPPRKPQQPIFDRHLIEHVLVIGGAMALLAFGVFAFLQIEGFSTSASQNLLLLLMVLFGNIHALSSRSESRSLFSLRWLANPFLIIAVPLAQLIHIGAMYVPGLRDVLGISPVSLNTWLCLALVACVLLSMEEAHKWTIRRRMHRHDSSCRE